MDEKRNVEAEVHGAAAEAWARRVDRDTLAAMLTANQPNSEYTKAARREMERRERGRS